MISAYRTGVAGQAGITLVSLAYGANGVVWAAATCSGPASLLGADSAVRVTEVPSARCPPCRCWPVCRTARSARAARRCWRCRC